MSVIMNGVPRKNERIVLVSLEGRKASIVETNVDNEKEVMLMSYVFYDLFGQFQMVYRNMAGL